VIDVGHDGKVANVLTSHVQLTIERRAEPPALGRGKQCSCREAECKRAAIYISRMSKISKGEMGEASVRKEGESRCVNRRRRGVVKLFFCSCLSLSRNCLTF